jgi:UDP-N-acetylglucosamine 1-carboxyvinyltransferase
VLIPLADARPFQWEYRPDPVAPEIFTVVGGRPLTGTVPISGAKNAALKLLAAATLTGERCRLTNVPEIEDVRVMAGTLRDLGVVVDHPGDNVYEVASGDVEWLFVPLEAAARMRASFMLLGPLLARFGRVIISNPGGDRIGRRPVDLHVEAMRTLGASIEYRNGYYFATSPGRLHGGEIRFPFVSVMGTENAMLAATLAEGHTVIRPAAQEPEVDDLIEFLNKMGAAVERTYPDTIEIEGRKRLRGAEHRVVPDRIEAGTFIVAAAVTGGHLTLEGAPCDHLAAFIETLGRAGVGIGCARRARASSPARAQRCSTRSRSHSRRCSRPPSPSAGWRSRCLACPASGRRPRRRWRARRSRPSRISCSFCRAPTRTGARSRRSRSSRSDARRSLPAR